MKWHIALWVPSIAIWFVVADRMGMQPTAIAVATTWQVALFVGWLIGSTERRSP